MSEVWLTKRGGDGGVDIDWEYPGGNGEDYIQTPNSQKSWEIETHPELLREIRLALGPRKLISAAVPGHPRDMLAFTKATVPEISSVLDFLNVMTYNLVNRRDNVTGHHAGLASSEAGIQAYLANGPDPRKAHLGFAFYPRWYKTDPHGNCSANAVGCKTLLMEDPSSGADLGRAGAFAWSDDVPTDLSTSFHRAVSNGRYDADGGGHYIWDSHDNIFWSWDTPEAPSRKFPAIVERLGLGGVSSSQPSWLRQEAMNLCCHPSKLEIRRASSTQRRSP